MTPHLILPHLILRIDSDTSDDKNASANNRISSSSLLVFR